MTTLKATQLKKAFKNRTVVNNISIHVKTSEIIGLLGPNGAGKTTTFNMIVGLIKPDSGQVILDDINISKLPINKRAMLGLGYLPQDRSVFRSLTVQENIMAIVQRRKELNKDQKTETVLSLMQEFHIVHLKNTLAMSLSGGESRRLEIARALAMNPQFMLLDEPFAGIDPISIIDIKRIITQLKNRNIGILITDHNVRETLSICERAYIVNEGTLIAEGSANDIINNQKVRDVYLGNEFNI